MVETNVTLADGTLEQLKDVDLSIPALGTLNVTLGSLVEITTNLNIALGQINVNIGKLEVTIEELTIPEVNFGGLITAIEALTEATLALQFNGQEIYLGDLLIKLSNRAVTLAEGT